MAACSTAPMSTYVIKSTSCETAVGLMKCKSRPFPVLFTLMTLVLLFINREYWEEGIPVACNDYEVQTEQDSTHFQGFRLDRSEDR